jgi:O-antigen/teichoic acid export membrane protein
MGIIQRQSIKYSVLGLLSTIIGALSTLLVYPNVLEQYGFLRLVLESGIILFPLLAAGSSLTAVRFFPRFRQDYEGHHGFLGLLLLLQLIFTIAIAMLFFLFKHHILGYYATKNSLFQLHLWVMAPVALLHSISHTIYIYLQNFQRIAFPSLLLDFLPKITLPLLLVGVSMLGVIFFLKQLGQLHLTIDWKFITPSLRKEFLQYLAFSIFFGFGSILALRADTFLVGTLVTLSGAGIYAIATFIAGSMEIPTRGLVMSSSMKVADCNEHGRTQELADIYKNVSLHLLIPGIYVYFGILLCADYLFDILPNSQELKAGKAVLYLLGLARLIDMVGGINHYILYYSKYYKWSLLSILLLAITNIIFSLWAIPRFGLKGAAFSNLMAWLLYNAYSVGFIYYTQRIHPFTSNMISVLSAGLIAFVMGWLIPHFTTAPLVLLLVKGGVFSIVFFLLLLRFRVSKEIMAMADKYIKW